MFEISLDISFPVSFSVDADSSVDPSLDVIQIYFDTATYDEVEKDVKVISQSQSIISLVNVQIPLTITE